jgi:hypothetical protein
MQTDQIFNERGLLRSDLENVRVPPERQAVFDSLVSAIRGAEASEEDAKRADKWVADAVRNLNQTIAATPKSDFMDEWRAATGKPKPAAPQTAGPEEAASSSIAATDGPPPPSIRDCEKALELARAELRQCRDAVGGARERVARTLSAYNASTPTMTRDENIRQWIASNEEDRKRKAALRYGLATVTQTARAMAGGQGPGPSLNTQGQIVGGGARAGGGSAYRRGPGGQRAYTKREAAILNAQRIAAARAGKLPSDR